MMLLEISLPGHEPDDPLNDMLGLREVARGVTPPRKRKRRKMLRGGFEYVALANDELAAVAAVRIRRRRENRERNERAAS